MTSLIQKFVVFDGHDIQSFNLNSLRRQISLVGQEPTLFATSIFENIRYGLKTNSEQLGDAEIEERVVQAAKDANAHDFISGLPLGYQTEVGEKGLQLSGGQRQRITVARGLISSPKLLLLDEATSALDVNSEKVVQVALEKAARDRTTIIVAHRLSTIRHADKIVVLSKGRVVEEGRHDDLMLKKEHYFNLVENQQISDLDSNEQSAEIQSSNEESLIGVSNISKVPDQSKEKIEGESIIHSELVQTSMAEHSREQKDGDALSFFATSKFIGKLNKPQFKLLAFGLALAALSGLGTPGYVSPLLSQALYLRTCTNYYKGNRSYSRK